MFRFYRFCSALCILLIGAVSASAQLITGVADRTTYTDSATFNVPTNIGYTYQVTLNDIPVAAGVSQTVTRMDYYDLLAKRTQISDGSVSNQLIRFIVMASDRGSPERGLIK